MKRKVLLLLMLLLPLGKAAVCIGQTAVNCVTPMKQIIVT